MYENFFKYVMYGISYIWKNKDKFVRLILNQKHFNNNN